MRGVPFCPGRAGAGGIACSIPLVCNWDRYLSLASSRTRSSGVKGFVGLTAASVPCNSLYLTSHGSAGAGVAKGFAGREAAGSGLRSNG